MPLELVIEIFNDSFDIGVPFKSVNITDKFPPSFYSLLLVILMLVGSFAFAEVKNITPIAAARITTIITNTIIILL